jgi:hypothetical protein
MCLYVRDWWRPCRQATGTDKQFQFALVIEQLGALLMEFEPSVHQASLLHVVTLSSSVCFSLVTVFLCLSFLMQRTSRTFLYEYIVHGPVKYRWENGKVIPVLN